MPHRIVSLIRVFMTDGNQYFNRPEPRVVESAEIPGGCCKQPLRLRGERIDSKAVDQTQAEFVRRTRPPCLPVRGPGRAVSLPCATTDATISRRRAGRRR